MSPAEIERNIKRLDRALAQKVAGEMYVQEIAHINERIVDADRLTRERIADVASDVEAVARRIDSLTGSVDTRFKAQDEAVEKRFKDQADRGQTSWGRVTVVLTLVLALAGLLWGVYASSKGIK